jgi:hypothetical protein
MKTADKIKFWTPSGEWLATMATFVGCFLFVHHENSALTQRLDDHMNEIHKRCDDLHKRSDEMANQAAKERRENEQRFYDLLKELHRKD